MDITLLMLNPVLSSFPLLSLSVLTVVVAVSTLLDSLNQRRAGQKGRIIPPAVNGERGRPVVLRPDVVLFSGLIMSGLVVIPDLVSWLTATLQVYGVGYSQTPIFRSTVLFLTIVGMVGYLVGIRRFTRRGLEEFLKRRNRGRSALEASPVLVSEIMTPRAEVVTVRESATLEEVRTVLSQHKVSRLEQPQHH